VDDRLHVAVSLLPHPDTWTMSNGIPVTVEREAEELRKMPSSKPFACSEQRA
jgi:hypothetical protein